MISLELFRRFIDKNEGSLDLSKIEKESGLEKGTLETLTRNTEIGHVDFHNLKQSLSKYGYSDFLFKNSRDPLSIGLTFWAVKGGPGKTTLTKFVGYALAHLGFKVLMIDNDHQCNLTEALLDDDYEGEIQTSAFDLYQTDFVWNPIRIEDKIDLIPGSEELADARDIIKSKPHSGTRISKAIEPYRYDYDYFLIDSRPDKHEIMVTNSLTAVDYVFTPLSPDAYSLKGVDDAYKEIQQIRSEFNHTVKMGGVILNKYKANRNVSTFLFDSLIENYPEDFINAPIVDAEQVNQQTFLAENIFNLNSKSNFKDSIISLSSEIVKRTKE